MIELRKATLQDIPMMQALVVDEVKKGVILFRSDDEVATNIRSYTLVFKEEKLIGYTALHIHSPNLAEIRSLIVGTDARGEGAGKALVEFCKEEAKLLGIKEILVLTYIADFFKKLDFKEIDKEKIPDHKIWADCIKCIHFPVCNEISLIYKV
ncbi:MAG TPA: N-acetyltransferase [Nitratifractor sp.]|nr:N-acetyltransferase [Nitratifractor sp.]